MGTGAVVQFKQKGRRYHLPVTPVIPPATPSAVPPAAVAPAPVDPASPYSRTRLDIAAAQALALEKVGGGTVIEYKLDHDDGRLVHEMKVVHGGTRYEVDIDDASGTVVKLSVD